jgi:predicted HicB family RNase H-like nuclease
MKARTTSGASGGPTTGDGPVMLCVRVPASLRRRVKLAAIQAGRSVQELATEALEEECRRRGV